MFNFVHAYDMHKILLSFRAQQNIVWLIRMLSHDIKLCIGCNMKDSLMTSWEHWVVSRPEAAAKNWDYYV